MICWRNSIRHLLEEAVQFLPHVFGHIDSRWEPKADTVERMLDVVATVATATLTKRDEMEEILKTATDTVHRLAPLYAADLLSQFGKRAAVPGRSVPEDQSGQGNMTQMAKNDTQTWQCLVG